MPRAAVLSIHARVTGTGRRLRGPLPRPGLGSALQRVRRCGAGPCRVHARAAARRRRLRRAQDMADRLEAFLGGRRMPYEQAGRGDGPEPERAPIRRADRTGADPLGRGAIADDLDGAAAGGWSARRTPRTRAPVSPRPRAEPSGRVRGLGGDQAERAPDIVDVLAGELVPVRTPVGDGWILAADESSFRAAGAARPLRACCPAVTRTSSRGARIASCSCSTPFAARSSGRPASGRALCCSRARSPASGDAQANVSISPGVRSRRPSDRRSKPRLCRCRCPASRARSASAWQG